MTGGMLLHPRRSGMALRRAALLIAWTAALLIVPASPAAAHAFLESSDPAANAVLPSAPGTVTLRFTEPLETSYSRAELFDQTGSPVTGATSAVGSDPRVMTIDIPPGLGNGAYSILWRTLSSADGHTAQGYLPFTVGTEAGVTAGLEPAQESLSALIPDWVYAASRWLALIGLAAVVAIWPFWIFVVRPAISPVWQLGPTTTRRAHRYAVGAVAFALVANILALLVQAGAIAGPADIPSGLMTTLGDTRYGTWWLVRVGALLIFCAALLGAAWWWPWKRRAATLLVLVVGAVLPIPFSMISHAAAEPAGQATAVAFDYAHLLGASLWGGGILFLVATLVPTLGGLTAAGRRVVLGRAIPRFSVLALIAWGVMALTGFYSAWLQVGNLPALTGTPYGQTLILKLILVVSLLLLGAFNLAMVTRKLKSVGTVEQVEGWGRHFATAVIAEAIILTLLLGVVGILIGTPPARQVMAQQAGSLRIPLAADEQTGMLIISPGIVGQNRYRLELGSGHEAHLLNPVLIDARLRLELPERETGQVDIPMVPASTGGYEAQGAELAFSGDWQFQVTVREPGQPDWIATAMAAVTTDPAPAQVPDPPPLFGPGGIVALILLVGGIVGLVVGVFSGTGSFRKAAIGLGSAAIVVGLLLLLQARLSSEAVAAVDAGAAEWLAPAPSQKEAARLIFAQEAGRWRVDETRREDVQIDVTPVAVATASGS